MAGMDRQERAAAKTRREKEKRDADAARRVDRDGVLLELGQNT